MTGWWGSPHLAGIGRALRAAPWQWRAFYLTIVAVGFPTGLAVGWWVL